MKLFYRIVSTLERLAFVNNGGHYSLNVRVKFTLYESDWIGISFFKESKFTLSRVNYVYVTLDR